MTKRDSIYTCTLRERNKETREQRVVVAREEKE